jgi:hypothetical protein
MARKAVSRHQYLDDDRDVILGILDQDDDGLVIELDQQSWEEEEEEEEEEEKEPDVVEEILEDVVPVYDGTQEVNAGVFSVNLI